jgi:hypothetical protein
MKSRGIALLCFSDLGTRRVWGISVTPRPLYTPGKDPVPIVKEAVWVPGSVLTGTKNLASHRDSILGPSIQPVASRCTDWATWPTNIRPSQDKYCISAILYPALLRVIASVSASLSQRLATLFRCERDSRLYKRRVFKPIHFISKNF